MRSIVFTNARPEGPPTRLDLASAARTTFSIEQHFVLRTFLSTASRRRHTSMPHASLLPSRSIQCATELPITERLHFLNHLPAPRFFPIRGRTTGIHLPVLHIQDSTRASGAQLESPRSAHNQSRVFFFATHNDFTHRVLTSTSTRATPARTMGLHKWEEREARNTETTAPRHAASRRNILWWSHLRCRHNTVHNTLPYYIHVPAAVAIKLLIYPALLGL
ncbi:hypothetical protein H4582DRAFT_331564 [Lactarius indigo]|nr:hypothetical protein H4582DRAFT_331564 [Lactarius indigo]